MNRRSGTSAHPRRRRRWAILALLAAGWFLHDAALHAALTVIGVNELIGMEFSLPDLTRQGIMPDRLIQTLALLFAGAMAGGLLALGLRLLARTQQDGEIIQAGRRRVERNRRPIV